MGTGRSRSRRGWITLHLSEQVQNVGLIPGATGSPLRVLSKDRTVISGIFDCSGVNRLERSRSGCGESSEAVAAAVF